MKVHINLLAPDERSNPGVMLIRTATGTLLFVAVAAVVLYGLHAFWMLRDAQNGLQRAESQWLALKADFERSERLQVEHASLESLMSDLVAFSNAQVAVSTRLEGLARCIPSDVQLAEVDWSQALVDDDGRSARQQVLKIVGRTASAGSEARVKALLAALKRSAADFGDVLPGGIRVDPQAGNAQEVIFEIRCVFAARRFQ